MDAHSQDSVVHPQSIDCKEYAWRLIGGDCRRPMDGAPALVARPGTALEQHVAAPRYVHNRRSPTLSTWNRGHMARLINSSRTPMAGQPIRSAKSSCRPATSALTASASGLSGRPCAGPPSGAGTRVRKPFTSCPWRARRSRRRDISGSGSRLRHTTWTSGSNTHTRSAGSETNLDAPAPAVRWKGRKDGSFTTRSLRTDSWAV